MKHILNYINEAIITNDITDKDIVNDEYLLCRAWYYPIRYILDNISSLKNIVKVTNRYDSFFMTTKDTLKQVYYKVLDKYGQRSVVLGADNNYSAIHIYAKDKRPVLYCPGYNFNEEQATTFFKQGMEYYSDAGRPWKVTSHEFLRTNDEIKNS